MITTLLLFALQAAPMPATVKGFGDWAVACDNGKRCEMTSLMSETAGDDGADFWSGIEIIREAGPAGGYTITFPLETKESGELHVMIVGVMATGGFAKGETLTFTGAKAAAVIAAMANGKVLSVIDFGGGVLGSTSLLGSSAMLRFVDAAQGRAGTVTAAVAKGTKPASAVPAAPALPRVVAVKPSGKAAPVSKAMTASLLKRIDCENPEDTNLTVAAYALTPSETLLLVPCGSGAYNFMSVAMILKGGKATDALFDRPPDFGEGNSHPTLVNADFDPKAGILSTYAKGRGPGDCGNSEDYVWDGARFRLTRARAMDECRGSVNWLTTWRAEGAR